MTKKETQKTTVENIIKLDSLKDKLNGPDLEKLEEVILSLKDSAGDLVSKTNASNMLHVSRQTIDRWIKKGKIPAQVGANGREQIPREVIEKLAAEVRDLKAVGQTRSVLADALRRAAKDIDPAKKSVAKKATRKPAKKPVAKKTKATPKKPVVKN